MFVLNQTCCNFMHLPFLQKISMNANRENITVTIEMLIVVIPLGYLNVRAMLVLMVMDMNAKVNSSTYHVMYLYRD